MDVVGEGLHVGELVVGLDVAAGVALAFPGVVDVDVDVAGVAHAGGDEEVGGVADVLVGDLAGEEVPAVPAHGWGGGDGFVLGEGCGGEKKKSDEEALGWSCDWLHLVFSAGLLPGKFSGKGWRCRYGCRVL